MSRTVSTPPRCEAVTYAHVGHQDCDEYRDDMENLRATLRAAFPSLRPCDKWLGREDWAFLENGHAYFGVSEYCGLVAVWIARRDDEAHALAAQWLAQVEPRFHALVNGYFGTSALRHVATFSNGEAVYQRITT